MKNVIKFFTSFFNQKEEKQKAELARKEQEEKVRAELAQKEEEKLKAKLARKEQREKQKAELARKEQEEKAKVELARKEQEEKAKVELARKEEEMKIQKQKRYNEEFINWDNSIETVKVGNKIWMKENLKITKFRNGDDIPELFAYPDWRGAVNMKNPAWCLFDNIKRAKDEIGIIYNWYAIIDERGFAPPGWRVPTEDDWNDLLLKMGYVSGFISRDKIDEVNRSLKEKLGLQQVGHYRKSDGFFHNTNFLFTYYFSSTLRFGNDNVMCLGFSSGYEGTMMYPMHNSIGTYVRLVKDVG